MRIALALLLVAQASPVPEAYHLRPGDGVLMLGDSITAEGRFFAMIFNDDLARKHPELVMENGKPGKDLKGPGLRFVNAGAAGETAGDGLKRLPKLLAEHKPTVAVVCFGMNDRLKDRRGYAENMRAIVKSLKEARVAVTILTAPCVYTLKREELQPYIAVLSEMAGDARRIATEEGVGFADCFTPTRKYMDEKKKDFTWGDGIHPNNDGHRMIADALQAAWGFGKPLLKSGASRAAVAPPPLPAVKQAGPKRHWNNATGDVGAPRWGPGGVTAMAVLPGSETVVAGVSGSGLWSTDDGGSQWKLLGMDGKDQIRGRPYQILCDPRNPWTFWVGASHGPGVYKTQDRGKSFVQLGTLQHVAGISIDFGDPERRTVVVGQYETDYSAHVTFDDGKTWTKIGNKLPGNSSFSMDPLVINGTTYLVASAGHIPHRIHGIYRTEDSGDRWTRVCDAGAQGPALVASDGAIYWSRPYGAGLLKSVDKGLTWTKLPAPARGNPIELPGGRILSFAAAQLHVSADGGKTWSALGIALPFEPDGLVFSEPRRALYAWRTSGEKIPDAIVRWDMPAQGK